MQTSICRRLNSIHLRSQLAISRILWTDDVSTWREGLLQQLKGRGMKEECRALEHIVLQAEEQDCHRMQQILLEVQTLTRRQTWLTYRPAYLLEVIADSQVRLVQNAAQLLSTRNGIL